MPIRLVLGLGNPGERYAGTRHNVGFMLVARAADASGAALKGFERLGEYVRAPAGGGDELYWARPLTYMNESGRMARRFSEYFGIAPAEMLVCYDEFQLPLGRLRLRPRGSAGGHNGMQSVVDHLGTTDVPRLRIGIGPLPPGRDPADFVLSRFASQDRPALERALEAALDAVVQSRARGIEAAMSAFNAEPEAP
ncbi:MAG: aminoacyl-tRNA hydrolase [Elusimicrobia bacterium]|nr:aminoacyl-tRNA hydrolase [Elusimicrobiota bacterium]